MRLRIEQDQDAQSPAEWQDNGLFLVAGHRDFWVAVPGMEKDWRGYDSMRELIPDKEAEYHVFMVEAYIHGGIRLALANQGNFPDRRWDVSLCGAIFAAKSEWPLQESALKAAGSLIEEWNQYLSGDVWGCIVEDDNGNHVDSCWGFYGREYAEEQGAEMLARAEQNNCLGASI